MQRIFYRYILYYALGAAVFVAAPFIFIAKILGFYSWAKFAIDLTFREKVMRKLVYCLCQLETANFSSSLYKRANNVCGMGVPSTLSYSTSSGTMQATEANKSSYPFVFSGVYDLFLWFKFRSGSLQAFNVVAGNKSISPDQALQECTQLLSQYRFTSTPAVMYYGNMTVYLQKFRATFFLSLFFLASGIVTLCYIFVKFVKPLIKKKK